MAIYYQFRRDGILSQRYKTPEEAAAALFQASRDHNWTPPTVDGMYYVMRGSPRWGLSGYIEIRQRDAIRLWRSATGRSDAKFVCRINPGGVLDLYPA
jgi:hypothetical protein